MLLLKIRQNKGLANFSRSVNRLENRCHWLGFLEFPDIVAALILSEKIKEDFSIGFLTPIPAEDDVLFQFKIVFEHEVVDYFLIFALLNGYSTRLCFLLNKTSLNFHQFFLLLFKARSIYVEISLERRELFMRNGPIPQVCILFVVRSKFTQIIAIDVYDRCESTDTAIDLLEQILKPQTPTWQ